MLDAGHQPGAAPDDSALAVEAWNLCAGDFWPALPVLCELYGIVDVDRFVMQLTMIRDRKK